MMRTPTLEAINAAELRLVQSKQNVRIGVSRTNSALRATLARPSTLVTVALASGISAYLLTTRRRPSEKSVPDRADSPPKASIPGFLRTLISMYGLRVLTMLIQLGAAASKKGQPSNAPGSPDHSATAATSARSSVEGTSPTPASRPAATP